jgi:hypothetical protein
MPGVTRVAQRAGASTAPTRPTAADAPPSRWWAVALALVPAATHLACILTAGRRWQFDLYEDDAYYYLGVARSLAEGDGSTFTGLVPTNGYHPLWTLVLVPLAAILRDPNALVIGVAVLQGALWALAVREALRIGRLLGCWPLAAGALCAYAVLAVLTGHLAFNGMESALLLPLLLLVLRLGLEAGDRPGDDLRIGVVLALVCLARLDAVVAAAPLALVVLLRSPEGDPPPQIAFLRPQIPVSGTQCRRRVVALAGPPAVALATYIAVNLAVFDTALPVSGRAKGLGAPFTNLEPVRQLLQAGDFAGRPLWFGSAVLVLVAVAWASGAWRRDARLGRVMAYALALLVGECLLLAYLVVGTSYRVWPWYHYQVAVLAFCAALVALRAALDRYGPVVVRLCLVGAGLFLVVQAGVAFRPEGRAYPGSVRGAEWVDESLPEDAVLAMGDRAGIFGFLARRPLLHLEGLMADADHLRAMEDGTAAERLAGEGVDYYVRYGPPGVEVEVDGRPCRRFDEPLQGDGPKVPIVVCDEDRVFATGPDGDQLEIWAFRPELQGAGAR